MIKYILKIISVWLIKYLQKRYKTLSIKNKYSQTNKVIAKLRLIQSVLYYLKCQFNAWGYFHPGGLWTSEDERYFRKLFPQKDFSELNIVVWHNPEAITYYHNKIWELSKKKPPLYEVEIKNQLIKWRNWN